MSVIVQAHGAGLTWYEGDAMARAAHALRTPGGVWLIDPFEDGPALDAAAQLGNPLGVVQLLSRHNRDCAAIADRLGISHHAIPTALPGSPFQIISVIDRPWWRETALWWQEQRTLIVAEAIGTGPLFALGRAAGVHPALRMVPPRSALGAIHPDRLLVGHGPPLETGGDTALSDALDHSRSDLPGMILRAPSALRRGPRGPATA
jgi:hypothetical protein